MKAFFIIAATVLMALGSASVSVVAQGPGPTKAGTIATAKGAMAVYEPGKRIVVKNADGTETSYRYGDDVVFVTPGGVVLTPAQVKARVKAGLPIQLEYIPDGDTRVVRRVIVEETILKED